jgi:UDP-3-O-[3-hydroxymyristoyl] glucosamine N-acyltransferase
VTATEYTLEQLARRLEARRVGPPDLVIRGLASLAAAAPDQLSHLSSPRYRSALASSSAGAVILAPEDLTRWAGAALVVDRPYLTYARATRLFEQAQSISPASVRPPVIDASAVVADTAVVAEGVIIGPRSRVGARVRLHPYVVIGADCSVDEDVELMPHVVLYSRVEIGARSVVHAGAILGSDGFGFTPDERGRLEPIAQLGGLSIGADVRIGAATTIDRGALGDTVIGDGVKIDNQVQIGHNCQIGAHTVICGCVGIVGSTTIGRHCVLAGGAGIGGDGPITLCDGVVVSGMTHVSASIDTPGVYSGGVLHGPTRQWKRNALRFSELDGLARRVARLERQLAAAGVEMTERNA